MAQPEIPGTDLGKVIMLYGSDGSKWIALLVDTLGRLQVDAEVDNFPADPATQTTLNALLTELKLKADLTETQPISVEGFDPVPTTPVWEHEDLKACVSGSYISVKNATVTTNQTWYITSFWIGPFFHTATVSFLSRLMVGGVEVWRRVFADGDSGHVVIPTPRQATTGQAVSIEVYQDSGGDVNFAGGFAGFEV